MELFIFITNETLIFILHFTFIVQRHKGFVGMNTISQAYVVERPVLWQIVSMPQLGKKMVSCTFT